MDPIRYSKFDEEYFGKVKELTKEFSNRRLELAEARLKLYSATLYKLLVELDVKYDLIVAPGNSGAFMVEIAKMVYSKLGREMPYILRIPVHRPDPTKKVDNSHLVAITKESLKHIPNIEKVLFVDDEIAKGSTAKECIECILKAREDIKHMQFTIVAENHFFEWREFIPQVSVNLYSFAPIILGIVNNITYLVPDDFFESCKPYIHKKTVLRNHLMTIMLSGVIKEKYENGQGYYVTNPEELLKEKVENYNKEKEKIIQRISELVEEGMNQYKSGILTFKY